MRRSEPNDSSSERNAKRRRVFVFAFLPYLVVALSYFGAFSPILSPLVYPNLAPPGWHNITPHGKIVLDDFAASDETPGLMVACGSAFNITVIDLTTWIPGRLHFWFSRDGGAHWQLLHPPFGDVQQCRVSLLAGEPGAFVASVSTSAFSTSSTNATATWVTWISSDTGASWHRITPNPVYGLGAYHRHGLLYGLAGYYDSTGSQVDYAMAVSTDHGATWAPIPSTSSKLRQQGWRIDDEVPDYRGDSWWYRVWTLQGRSPVLEHSTDDGRTWTLVGAIGTEPMQPVLLATTPLLPGHVCAAQISGETNHLSLFASADGGQTWRRGVMPANLANTTGEETGISLQIGANGDCYQGYLYHRAQAPANEHDYMYLRLTSRSLLLQEIPIGNGQNITSGMTKYIPAGNGMGARLIVNSELPESGWASIFSGAATETNEDQLLWAAVP